MSAPETNALSPAPTRITTRTSGSSRNSTRARPSPCHMSSDMALRFAGLLKVMTPTPSVTLCRILPSAWDLSVVLATFSIGAAFADESSTFGSMEDVSLYPNRPSLGQGPAQPQASWRRQQLSFFAYLFYQKSRI